MTENTDNVGPPLNESQNSHFLPISKRVFSRWTQRIQDRLSFAETMSNPRTQWPKELDKFPIKHFPLIQKIILKLLGTIFKDQRSINQNLVYAVREILASIDSMNSIHEQVEQLNAMAQKFDLALRKLKSTQATIPTLTLEEETRDRNFVEDFYASFENKFRGSPSEVSEKLSHYLGCITETRFAGQLNSPIVDIGCGRGEWLEILKGAGYSAKGVDLNETTVNLCQSKGLDVILADALSYLDSLPEMSLGAVTGFHIIEHLPFDVLLKLFHKCSKVLKPRGIIIFETPNPHNLLVSSYSFYLDPTHRNPLPSPLVQFAAEYCGFKSVRIHGLHPYPDSMRFSGTDSDKLNEYFRSHQDYAVIGYRE